MPAPKVAQMHVVSQLPLQRARFQLSIGEILRFVAHHRLDRQIFGESPVASVHPEIRDSWMEPSAVSIQHSA